VGSYLLIAKYKYIIFGIIKENYDKDVMGQQFILLFDKNSCYV
jgi:hypothetical protein